MDEVRVKLTTKGRRYRPYTMERIIPGITKEQIKALHRLEVVTVTDDQAKIMQSHNIAVVEAVVPKIRREKREEE
jgi:hypothetical protein